MVKEKYFKHELWYVVNTLNWKRIHFHEYQRKIENWTLFHLINKRNKHKLLNIILP